VYLKDLTVLNFKNYSSAEIRFDDKVNCLVGMNGSGKTNLLDAIYYLAFSKSFFNPSDSQNILLDEVFFSIQGSFVNGDVRQKVQCSIKKGHKKVINRNGKVYQRFADHIGLIPTVMISPIDILLIIEGSEVRRKWLDGIIAQFDRKYLDKLILYNKALIQRNKFLKNIRNSSQVTEELEIWNDHLIENGIFIYERRLEIMKDLIENFNIYYKIISDEMETVGIDYHSHLQAEQSFEEQLKKSIDKDLRLQYTSVGIHKDDIDFNIASRSVKKFASQGQQKSVLLALRLAQAKLIYDSKGTRPLMLLDDIYDKLDSQRMMRLFEILKTEEFGQLFVTDTNFEHMTDLLKISGLKAKFFEVKQGEIFEMQTEVLA